MFSSQWLNLVSQGNALLSAELFRKPVSRVLVISLQHDMASKTSQTNLSEQGKLLLAKLGRDFLEVETEQRLYMTGKRWEKRQNHEWKLKLI